MDRNTKVEKAGADLGLDAADETHAPGHEIPPPGQDKVHKRALLKLDLILLSTVTVIYFLNFLDRYVDSGN